MSFMRSYTHRRLERQRAERLRVKAQKAGVLDRVSEVITSCPTWGKRFRTIQRMRVRP